MAKSNFKCFRCFRYHWVECDYFVFWAAERVKNVLKKGHR